MRSQLNLRLVQFTLWALFAVSALTSIWAWSSDSVLEFDLFRWTVGGVDFAFGLRFDTLSTLILLMVTLLGASIAKYSARYLDGEMRQRYFFNNLLLTVVFVSLMVAASNLAMFFVAWCGTSAGLHRLLTFYRERPAAVEAARKKFIISRIGDVAIVLAIFLVYRVFGTLEFSAIFSQVGGITVNSTKDQLLSLAGFLFVLGAMTKSAQVPFHFWLPETMETPTPVSALMHAGIINAGGFLVIRLSPVLQHAEAAHILLLLVGAMTAVFGSLVMITQTDIKKKLAYSTIGQMGMMMFACGLSAYSFALFHMIAHSFYKAHAFLSTGNLVEESKKIGVKLVSPSLSQLAFISFIGFLPVLAAGLYDGGIHLAHVAYASVLALGLLQSFTFKTNFSYSRSRAILGIGSLLIFAIATFVAIEISMNYHLAPFVPIMWEPSPWFAPHILATYLAYGLFAMGFALSGILIRGQSEFARRLFFYLWNGGYYSIQTSRALAGFGLAGR